MSPAVARRLDRGHWLDPSGRPRAPDDVLAAGGGRVRGGRRAQPGRQRHPGHPAGTGRRRLGLSEALLGLVAALAADTPEVTSAVTALAHGQHDVGTGVVLGSNVFNLAALIGLGAVVPGASNCTVGSSSSRAPWHCG